MTPTSEIETVEKGDFWLALTVLLRNFHTIYRYYFASIIVSVEEVSKGLEECKLQPDGNLSEPIVQKASRDEAYLLDVLCNFKDSSKIKYEGFLITSNLLTKKLNQDTVKAFVIVDIHNTAFTLRFNSLKLKDIEVHLDENGIPVCRTFDLKGDTHSNCERLQRYVFMPKFVKWCHENATNRANRNQIQSLSMIDVSGYNDLYKQLKRKYSDHLMKIWEIAEERTDPKKFIFEELAIAAYILMLWRNQSAVPAAPRGFMDLGCGNGLLVYILIEEGVPGYGLDVRSRRIWSFYPANVRECLIEKTVDPMLFQVPENVDWLLGNHSDELSAWIPILAARQRYDISFFLLPCCAFELSGSRFQRRNTCMSTYQDFCAFIEEISADCGFLVHRDRLRIPSTKRIAIIGSSRTYKSHQQSERVKMIEGLLSEQLSEGDGNELKAVQLRVKHESVKNCTKIDPTIINKIVDKIFNFLLDVPTSERLNKAEEEESPWNRGRAVTIQDVANQLDDTYRKHMTSEFGGLKTLLRNNHDIFEIMPKGIVRIRKPEQRDASSLKKQKRPFTLKKRICYMKLHHPQGCPLKDDQCSFIH